MDNTAEYSSQFSSDSTGKIRDLEERLRLLKDRLILLGQTHIDERERTFSEIQELKKTAIVLKQENLRIQELLKRVTEQLNDVTRKEDLAILQRQFNIFRKD